MEFKDVFNRHLGVYVSSGAKVSERLSFLTLLFLDIRKNNLDVEESRKVVCSTLNLSFTNEHMNRAYELCLLRDVDKAIALTVGEEPVSEPVEESEPKEVKESEEFPDDVPNIDREAFKNRKAVIDHEFLKSLGYVE